MDQSEEYHDPDYAGTSESVKEDTPTLSEDERIEKIKKIIRREFSNELEVRENEVMTIDQRMTTSRRLLHRLRYTLVNTYYREQKLQLSTEQLRDELAASKDEDRTRQEMSSVLRSSQRRLHPSLRKLLGAAGLAEVFSAGPRARARPDYSAMLGTRNYTIAADSTKSLRPAGEPGAAGAGAGPAGAGAGAAGTAGAGEAAGPSGGARRAPRRLEPRLDNVLTLAEQTRNKVKHRYRIVIGNTSKYVPPASRADRSTHKWLLYVRHYPNPAGSDPAGSDPTGSGSTEPCAGGVISAVTARLHHSYAPHHNVTLHKPPFHISRRGWGEFTARLQLQFPLPALNPPAHVHHTIRLDRNYTGLQTLGAETIVDVWLYSTPEMLKYAFVDTDTQPDTQADKPADTQTDKQTDIVLDLQPVKQEPEDSWMDFLTRDTAMDVDEMIIKPVKREPEVGVEGEPQIKEEPMEFEENLLRSPSRARSVSLSHARTRIMKYLDPDTGKIYYLEMDRNLDLSTVQEILINNATTSPVKNGTVKKKKVSLLKPEVKSSLKTDQINACFRHIANDHCYLGSGWSQKQCSDDTVSVLKESKLTYLRSCLCRLSDVRTSVYFLLRNIPLVDSRAADPEYRSEFPFVVESDEKYWKLDFAKRRNIEWSRAKLISRLLSEQPRSSATPAWRTKQVLVFARCHGFQHARPQPPADIRAEPWEGHSTSTIKELYQASDINTLSVFNSDSYKSEVTEIDLVESDEEVDVEVVGNARGRGRPRGGEESGEELEPLPPSEEDRLKFLFVEQVCADIGIELRNEDVGNGYSYSAVHAALLSAARSLAEELLRAALAAARLARAPPAGHVWAGWSSSGAVINLEHVYQACGGRVGGAGSGGGSGGSVAGRLQMFSARALGTERKNTSTL